MRCAKGLIHFLVCCVLIWQGAAGAVAAGRMASFDAVVAGALCRPGGGDARTSDPQAVADHAMCALHCGATQAGPAPEPPALAAPASRPVARAAAAPFADAPRPPLALPPPARGPPPFA